jgi:hypothetical protein
VGVFLSTNNGTSWTKSSNGVASSYVRAFALTGKNVFAAIPNNGVYSSTNNGVSWTNIDNRSDLNDIKSLGVSGTYLFAGTERRGVWKIPLSQVTSVRNNSTALPSGFNLAQNYPNPFNPSTEIQFSIPNTSFVSLKVFNVLGEEIATLVDENKPPGTHWVTWDANGYSSGVYFYRLMSAGKVFTGKMNLLK